MITQLEIIEATNGENKMLREFNSPVRKRKLFMLGFLAAFVSAFASIQNTSAKTTLDFDGDGKTDYAILRTTQGKSQFLMNWYILLSSGGSIVQQFGLGSIAQPMDRSLPEDYDGDGKCDIAVFRAFASSNQKALYVLESGTNTLRATPLADFHLGVMVQDYDGDGKADIADVWHDSDHNKIWRILESKSGQIRTVYFGTDTGDEPVRGDFDGDGVGDVAVYREDESSSAKTFYVLRSSDGMMEATIFGKDDDRPILADFDGDGKTDYAVTRQFEPGVFRTMWYWIESSTGEFRSLHFGESFHERVVPGDYDGDGRTDQAVTRLYGQDIIWYVNGSTNGMTAVNWGVGNDDLPINPTF